MEGYERLERAYRKVSDSSRRAFTKECSLSEESIAFSLSAYYWLAKCPGLKERSKELAAMFYRNCIYLSAAYRLARQGLLDPAGNNMRTVFETIVWQYAYLCDEGMYVNFRQVSNLEALKLNSLAKGAWSNTKERRLENLRRKNSFQKAMKSLYSKDVYERFFFSQYWMLCQKSHSSVFGANYNTPTMEGKTTMDKGPRELGANLSALLYLSAENLLCFLNCFSGEMPKDMEKAVLDFTNRINRSIPPSLSMVPDTKELKFKAMFRKS